MKNLLLLLLIGIQQLASAQNGIVWSAPVDISASGFIFNFVSFKLDSK